MFNIEARSEGPKFQIGDMLEVVSGIFQGYKGKLIKTEIDIRNHFLQFHNPETIIILNINT